MNEFHNAVCSFLSENNVNYWNTDYHNWNSDKMEWTWREITDYNICKTLINRFIKNNCNKMTQIQALYFKRKYVTSKRHFNYNESLTKLKPGYEKLTNLTNQNPIMKHI